MPHDCPGPLLESALLAATGLVRHGFTTRVRPDGGVFDIRARNETDPTARENRAIACQLMGIDPLTLRYLDQVHGNAVMHVTAADPACQALGDADGLLTAERGLPLQVRVADCAPVFLLDTKTPAIGLLHSGWRGTLANISAAGLAALREAYGTNPADCRAWIGPSISQAAFEVGEEVAAPFAERYGERWIDRSYPKPHVDNKGLIAWQLAQCGVPETMIETCGYCSMTEPWLCSYRRDGKDTPHAMGVLMLK